MMKHPCVRHLLSALAISCYFSGSGAIAATVTLTPVASASAQDGGTPEHPNLDGIYDTLLPSGSLFVAGFPTYDQRTIFEFTLPPELLQPGVTIEQATLVIPVLNADVTESAWGLMHLTVSAADATLTLDDFLTPAQVSLMVSPTVPADGYHRFDLRDLVSGFSYAFPNANRMSLMAGLDRPGGYVTNSYVQWDTNATLEVEYSLPPSPPTLSVISPTQDSQHWSTDDIYLQATATDAQDGNLDAAIHWTVSALDHSEPLGTGGNLTVNLPDGIYWIEIYVEDSDGAGAVEHRKIDVATLGNSRPSVTIDPPANQGQMFEGIASTFHASATDLEDGPVDQSIVWTNEHGEVLGEGPTLTTTMPLGTHPIFAAVTDSGGIRVVTDLWVSVVPAPYCNVGTLNTARGWIAKVTVNGGSKVSASNGGYADFTDREFFLALGDNAITLSPGGDPSVRKYWKVWIDLNRDNVFGADEVFVDGNGLSSITRTVTIPLRDGLTSPTRMRVGMRYSGSLQACGVSGAGEFEDYTVRIQF